MTLRINGLSAAITALKYPTGPMPRRRVAGAMYLLRKFVVWSVWAPLRIHIYRSSKTAVPPAATAAAAAPSTPALTIDDAMATITAMQAENKDLQDKLTSAQNDKGATLFAVAIVVIGLGLAFAVFFGLKQSGK